MYGVPSDSRAVCTTSAALPEIVAGGAGGGRSGAAPFPLLALPPALPPSPNDTPNVALTPLRASARGSQTPPGPRFSRGEQTSLPNPAPGGGRHSTPPPMAHCTATSWVEVAVESPT